MAYNANIILQGQGPDIMGALTRSNDAAQNQLGYQRQREVEQLYKTQGAGMLAGDQNSLNALAGFDPAAAQGLVQNQLGMDQTRQSMAINAEEMQMKRDEAKAQAAEALRAQAAALSAQDAAAEAAKVERGIAAASTAQSAQQWDAMAQQFGVPDLVGQFANKDAIIASYLGVADALKEFKPAGPLSSEGKFAADVAAGLLPAGAKPQPGVQVTNNMGEGSKFYDELDKGQATMFQTLMGEGVQAGRNMGQIDQLESVLTTVPTGAQAALQNFAGEWGINTEGLDNIQAAQAIINSIVPQQRMPGSGPMSDADLALFKQSVPRLINQPGGNKRIIDAMRGIAQYTQKQGEIAARVADRTMTPAEGRAALAALINPLEGIGKAAGAPKVETGAPARIDDQGPTQADFDKAYEQLPSGTVFVGPDGVKRRKP